MAGLVRNDSGDEHCAFCGDAGLIYGTRLVRGAIVRHNDAVRNYRGGPRPNFHRDQSVPTAEPCPDCERGRTAAREGRGY